MQLLSSFYLAGSMPLRNQAYLSDESAEQLQALCPKGVQGDCEGGGRQVQGAGEQGEGVGCGNGGREVQGKGGRRDLWLGRAGLSVRLLPLALLCLTHPGPCLTYPRPCHHPHTHTSPSRPPFTFTSTPPHRCSSWTPLAAQVVQV